MKEYPILFSTEMVRAILAGRKTMTRRIITPQPIIDEDSGSVFYPKYKNAFDIHGWQERMISTFSRIIPEDILWIRESWNVEQLPQPPEGDWDKLIYYYKATEIEFIDMKWRPSIHMPKEAARIWLQVKKITVQRLHDITEEDIIAEGIRVPTSQNGGILFKLGESNTAWEFMPEQWKKDRHVENRGKEKYVHRDFDYLFAHWAEIWCSINGRENWDSNPWVWAISFNILSTTGKPTQLLSKNIPQKATIYLFILKQFNYEKEKNAYP